MNKPKIGCKVFSTEKHMTKKGRQYAGLCIAVEGNTCIFETTDGDTDRLTWNWPKEGPNTWWSFE